MVVVLAGTRMSQLPARDSVPGPVSPLHLVLCPQEVDHTVQDLCLLHLWILQILDKRGKQCTDQIIHLVSSLELCVQDSD